MFHIPKACLLAVLAGLPWIPLAAEPRSQPVESSLQFTEDGSPVIQVTLRALKLPERTLACRFLVSTACEHTIIDRSIPTEFYWDDASLMHEYDASGDRHAFPGVLLKRIEVAGMARDGLPAARADLKRTMSPDHDEPVDGILGMSFLGGTRFIYDAAGRRIRWWAEPTQGVQVPILYGTNHTPAVTLTVGKDQVEAQLDLARMGGLYLPGRLKAVGKGEPIHVQAMMGPAVAGVDQEVERIEAGSGAWTGVHASFHDHLSFGGIGQDVWSAAPVCFDFIQDRLTLHLDSGGRLPLRPGSGRTLPVLWDRTGPVPKLVVVWVRPGSPMDLAGCRIGDELVRAGQLSGAKLSRRNLMALMAQGREHEWTVRRDGRLETVHLFRKQPGVIK